MSTKTPESQFSTTSKVQEVVSASPQKRASLQVDILEPRILLSGTWVEVAAVEEVAQVDAAIEDPSVWMEEKGGIYGTERNDWLKGTDSNDVLVGLEGDDVLYGGDGNDRFVYRDGDGVDQYIGGAGQDQIDATRATSLVLGEIHEKYSIEYIVGGEKGLTIEGTKESNYLDFSQVTLKNVSAIDAGYGDDVVIGSRADDVIIAGSGNDFLSGSEGENDVLVLSGNRTDYKVGELSSETLIIADRRGIDGEDQVTGFERYQFADGTVSREELFNHAPLGIKLDGGSVSESAEAGTIVGKLYTADADRGDAHAYELVDAKGNAVKDSNFAIKDNVIVVRDGNSLDYETASSQTLFVKTTDKAGASYIEEFTIHIDDANDAPVAIKLDCGSVSESAELGTIVGKLYTADADKGDSHTYELVDSKGNAVKDPNFLIKDNSIVVRDGHTLDYESSDIQTLHMQVTDKAGASHIEEIAIRIDDANDTPTATKLDGGSVSESAEAGTIVGRLFTSDADKVDSHTYQLVDAKGNAIDDSNFLVKENMIIVRDGNSLDYETATSQTLFVKTTDKAGASHIEEIAIRIEDANEAPIAVTGMITTSEDIPVAVRLGGIDLDARDTIELVRIDQLPPHGQLLLRGSPVALGENVSYDDITSGQLVFVSEKDWHGDTRLSFSVFDGEKWSEASADVALHVEAIADGASLTIEPARGLVGESVPLRLEALSLDSDGSEQLVVCISGLPERCSLSAGVRQTDGTWLLAVSDLPALVLTLPQEAQQFDLAITVTTTEDNGSASTMTGSLNVTVDAPVSIVPVSSPLTASPNSGFLSTDSESVARHIEYTGSVLEVTTEVSSRESTVLPERPVEDLSPVGDMFVTIRNQSIDWTETKFGDIHEIAPHERPETQSEPSTSRASVSDQDQSVEDTAIASTTTESVSGFVWMWSTVRALTGMRDDRKNR